MIFNSLATWNGPCIEPLPFPDNSFLWHFYFILYTGGEREQVRSFSYYFTDCFDKRHFIGDIWGQCPTGIGSDFDRFGNALVS